MDAQLVTVALVAFLINGISREPELTVTTLSVVGSASSTVVVSFTLSVASLEMSDSVLASRLDSVLLSVIRFSSSLNVVARSGCVAAVVTSVSLPVTRSSYTTVGVSIVLVSGMMVMFNSFSDAGVDARVVLRFASSVVALASDELVVASIKFVRVESSVSGEVDGVVVLAATSSSVGSGGTNRLGSC